MGQRMRASMAEVTSSLAVGMLLAYLVTLYVMPYFGFHPSASKAFAVTVVYTVISWVRGLVVRRIFNRLTVCKTDIEWRV